MAKYTTKKEQRQRRHMRLRKKVYGTHDCPRLCVRLSNKHIYLQCIDDEKGTTLVSVSSLTKDFLEQNAKTDVAGAGILGKIIGERVVNAGIKKVVFDCGGYRYHGRVKAIADAARNSGLKF